MSLENGNWDREVLDQIWQEPMALCYKPLLFMAMVDLADVSGRTSIQSISQYFSNFYQDRRKRDRVEENPKRFPAGNLPSDRSLSEWERVIRSEPLRRISDGIIQDEGPTVCWDEQRWSTWSSGIRKAIRNTAETRLIEYFDKYVPGGY
jgi:hypothetical protein